MTTVLFLLPRDSPYSPASAFHAKYDSLVEGESPTLSDFDTIQDLYVRFPSQKTLCLNPDPSCKLRLPQYRHIAIPGGYTQEPYEIAAAMVRWASYGGVQVQPLNIQILSDFPPLHTSDCLVTKYPDKAFSSLECARSLAPPSPLTTAPAEDFAVSLPITVADAIALVDLGGHLAGTTLSHLSILSGLDIDETGHLRTLPEPRQQPIRVMGGEVTRAILESINQHPKRNPKVSVVLEHVKQRTSRVISKEQFAFLVSEMPGIRLSNGRLEVYVYNVH